MTPAEYLFVASSPYFEARHGELLPALQHAPLSMGLSTMGIDYLRIHGGATYLPVRLADPLVAAGELFPVDDAPLIHQPVFVTHLPKNRHRPAVRAALELLEAIDFNAGTRARTA